NLSGGQKQLVAIARALYKKPCFLVLDESTSAMDFDTEKRALEILKQIAVRNRIGLLLVTHRITLARQTDKIYLLRDGTIQDSGSHEELIARENRYAGAFRDLAVEA
ncbi:MAG: ATP-binding cassette domain-containing protein, partial [Balneolaceae bacterium]